MTSIFLVIVKNCLYRIALERIVELKRFTEVPKYLVSFLFVLVPVQRCI